MTNAADATAALVRALKIEGLEIATSASFAANEPKHREIIRDAIIAAIKKNIAGALPDGVTALSDLALPPRLAGWAISVSHCPTLGGIALAPGDFGIGFDLEHTERVTPQAARRVAPTSAEQRIAETTTPASFWVAKESSIKAFGNLALTNLHYGVVEITALDSSGAFTARWNNHVARGLVTTAGSLTMGLARTL